MVKVSVRLTFDETRSRNRFAVVQQEVLNIMTVCLSVCLLVFVTRLANTTFPICTALPSTALQYFSTSPRRQDFLKELQFNVKCVFRFSKLLYLKKIIVFLFSLQPSLKHMLSARAR